MSRRRPRIPSRRSWSDRGVSLQGLTGTPSERIREVPKKKAPAKKGKRISTAQIVFLLLTVVIILSFVLSLIHV